MTLPAASTIQVSTVPLAAFTARMAAILAAAGTANPLPEIDFAAGTLRVGDGNSGAGPAVPSISTLQSTGALVHQVWSGQTVQSVVVDPANPSQIDISAVIPAVDANGNEIGPFWVSEFIITDETGTPMLAATTLAPKLVTSNGAAYDLNLQAAVGFSPGTVNLVAPSGAYLTEAGAANAISGLLVADLPLSVTPTVQSNGWTRWLISVATATMVALGVGRAASDAECAAGAPATGSNTAYPWPTLQQIKGVLASYALKSTVLQFPAQTTFYVNFAGGDDTTGDGLTPATAWATIQHAIDAISRTYVYFGVITIQCANGVFVAAAGTTAFNIYPSSIAGWAIVGNAASPSSCVINASAAGCRGATIWTSNCTITGFQISHYLEGVVSDNGAAVGVRSCNFVGVNGSSSVALAAYNGSYLDSAAASTNTLTFSGSFYSLIEVSGSSALFGYQDVNVTNYVTFALSGAVSVSVATVLCSLGGNVSFTPAGVTWTGAATGTRYVANMNGTINTNGSGGSYIPGSVAGSTSTGGQYA